MRWPDKGTVIDRLKAWAAATASNRPEVIRIGYFGSLARNDWGVGSDLDLVIIVEATEEPFERRGVEWETTELPVPVEVLVYTISEWEGMDQTHRFARTLNEELRWVYERNRQWSQHP